MSPEDVRLRPRHRDAPATVVPDEQTDYVTMHTRHFYAPPVDVALKRSALLWRGQRIPLGDEIVTIGSAPDNHIVVTDPGVAPKHASVRRHEGHWYLIDGGTETGTLLNGQVLMREHRRLNAGDAIFIGSETIFFVTYEHTGGALPVVGLPSDAHGRRRLVVGRDENADVVVDHPAVARRHVYIDVGPDGGAQIIDRSGGTGTRVNGMPVTRQRLAVGDEVGIGPVHLVYDGEALVPRDETEGLRLDARGLTVDVKTKRILDNVSLTVHPGEFVAVVGESGAGKSTLIKLLAGVNRPTHGSVLINGDSLATRLTDVGYVPQDEIVHGRLTVTEALTYAARLRLPQDSNTHDYALAVHYAVGELALQEHVRTNIERLSGGQRKRVGVATELLSRPRLMFLDEPTTGLDPGLERRMMEALRNLAHGSRAVMLVTHATQSLHLCDKLAVMGRGGLLCFYGTPQEALDFFQVAGHDDLYTALDTYPARDWATSFESRRHPQELAVPYAPHGGGWTQGRAPRRRRPFPQVATLASRYLKLFVRDRRNLAIVFAQVPLIALAISFMFKSGIFDQPDRSQEAAQLLFLLVTTVIWFGSIDAAREVVKERGVLFRELAVGVRIRAYLASKAVVLLSLAAIQTLITCLVVLTFRPLGESAPTVLIVVAVMVAASAASVGMGLVISTVVDTEDQASSFIPLVLIPQLLFGGAIVPVADLGQPIKLLSGVIVAQWGFAGAGTAADMNERIAGDPKFSQVSRYGTDFFDIPGALAVVILGAFLVAFFVICGAIIRRQAQRA